MVYLNSSIISLTMLKTIFLPSIVLPRSPVRDAPDADHRHGDNLWWEWRAEQACDENIISIHNNIYVENFYNENVISINSHQMIINNRNFYVRNKDNF